MTAKPHVWRFAWADSLRTLVAVHREVPGDGVDITAADARRLVAAVREGGPWKAVAAHGGGPAMLIDVGRTRPPLLCAGARGTFPVCVTDLASLGIWDPEPAPPELTLKKAQELVSALVAEHGEAVLERPGGPAEPGQLWTEAMTESPEAWATLSPAAREVFAEYEARFLKLLVELVTGARQRKGSEEA